MNRSALKRVRRAIDLPVNREPLPSYAWPGGYPLLYLFTDGGVICPACANENIEEIDAAIRAGNLPHSSGCGGWAICGVEPHYEGEPEICDHCGCEIESAYGVPEKVYNVIPDPCEENQ